MHRNSFILAKIGLTAEIPIFGKQHQPLTSINRPGGTTGDTWDESQVLLENLFSKSHKMPPVLFEVMK